jgi:hypothetical protein
MLMVRCFTVKIRKDYLGPFPFSPPERGKPEPKEHESETGGENDPARAGNADFVPVVFAQGGPTAYERHYDKQESGYLEKQQVKDMRNGTCRVGTGGPKGAQNTVAAGVASRHAAKSARR